MKAMILAAGRGQRLRPLTDTIPKPLIDINNGKTLIEYLIVSLRNAGIHEIVINHAYLGASIENALGNGERLQVKITYSPETLPGLETGGGIKKALPLLGNSPFIVINSDIWTDFPFQKLPSSPPKLAHLIMVDNPSHHPEGDFTLDQQYLCNAGKNRLTFSGIGVYRPELFNSDNSSTNKDARFSLKTLLLPAMRANNITGEYYSGEWMDIGTIERLTQLRNRFNGYQ